MAEQTRAQAAAESVNTATTFVLLAVTFAASPERFQEFVSSVQDGLGGMAAEPEVIEGARQIVGALTPEALIGAGAALQLFVQGITDAAGLIPDQALDRMLQFAFRGLN